MFSFVDSRLLLLIAATVLLTKGQGEEDSKYKLPLLDINLGIIA